MPASRPATHPLLAVILATLAVTAAGDEPRTPIDVTPLDPWQGRTVTSLDLAGMPDDLTAAARGGLALTPRRKLLTVARTRLSLDVAEADARRLRLLLARHGFPSATVTATGEADGEDGVAVTLRIDPGPVIRYGDVTVSGLPPAASAYADTARRRLARGERFADAAVATQREMLLAAQRRAGHARPEVELEVMQAASHTVDLTFTCRPGPSFVFGDLRVQGAPEDLVPLVRRTVALDPGTAYAPSVVNTARRRLRQLQLFRQVRLLTEPRDTTTLDLVADLKPRRMLTLEASVGSFTDDWLVARAGVRHRNLFRGGRGAGLGATWGVHLRELEASTWWPGLVTAHSRAELDVRGAIEDEESYRLETVETEVSNLFETWSRSSLRVGVTVSNGVLENRSADPDAFVSEVGLLTALGVMWFRDSSDDPIDPSRGTRVSVEGEWSPPGGWTDTPFATTRISASRYWPLGGRRTLAVRLDGSLGWPLGDAVDLRPDRRFFAGGVSTMRGYRRRDLGPRDRDDDPIGGEARLLAGAELRLPLVSLFGLAAFVDSGQVWRDRRDLDPGELAVAAGLGLLVYTPIGPVRLDVARNLSGLEDDQPRTLVHFAIGHPF